jgi:hypothetical protein
MTALDDAYLHAVCTYELCERVLPLLHHPVSRVLQSANGRTAGTASFTTTTCKTYHAGRRRRPDDGGTHGQPQQFRCCSEGARQS